MNNEIFDFAIINWWWENDHGAILTAYALQKLIEEFGYSSQLLKCWSHYSDEKRNGGISDKFASKNMCFSKEVYGTYQDLFETKAQEKINNKYKGFITGSDQVFRAEWVPDSWFLTFVNGRGKLAVAASFGKNEFTCLDPNRFERLKASIESFDFLSVRENDGVSICKKYFNRDALCILDPVFLANDVIYHKLFESINQTKDEYIFCYIRDFNQNTSNMINRIAENNKCKIVFCSEKMEIEEFLFYIKHSKMVITDSYHGLCFSIIFNKDYLCILNILRGKSRFESLATQLNLPTNNYVEENDIDKINTINHINYYEINKVLGTNREKDRIILKNAICEVYNKYK